MSVRAQIGEVSISRTGRRWWARLPDGSYLVEIQSTSWPPYPVIKVPPSEARSVTTKREAISLAERYNADELRPRRS